MPSAAPERVRLWTASTTISASRQIIMTLVTPLQTLLKAEAAHDQAGDHHQFREDGHGAGAAQHGAEHPGDLVAGHAGVEAAGEEFPK